MLASRPNMLCYKITAKVLEPLVDRIVPTSSAHSRRWWHLADRVGATASFLCAIHCAVLPFVLAMLPFLGLGFLADYRFEQIFVVCAALLASAALLTGYRRHRRRLPLLLVAPGVALLLVGVLVVDLDAQIVLHSTLVTCGGLLVATAHVINLRLTRRLHVHGERCISPEADTPAV